MWRPERGNVGAVNISPRVWTVSTLGSKGSSDYHHGDLKTALVEEGVAVARQDGLDAVQIRDLARRVGVSHNAAYRHFRNRDELLAAISARGFGELASAMQQAVHSTSDMSDPAARARARLRAIGREYVRYALAEPGLFKAIWTGVDLPTMASASDEAPTANPYMILTQVLDELVAAGALPEERRPRSEFVALSAVHGFSMLVTEGPLQVLPTSEIEQALDRLFDVVEAGL